jgi:hypothetical protein
MAEGSDQLGGAGGASGDRRSTWYRWPLRAALLVTALVAAGATAAALNHREPTPEPEVDVAVAAPVVSPLSGPFQRAQRVNTSPPPTSAPTTPPAPICGNAAALNGPDTPPPGATVVPAGNNASFDFGVAGRTYWFAPGVHTLGSDRYGQIVPGNNSTFVGAPGAIIDGQNRNVYAFTQRATGVTIRNLTIRNFGTGLDNNNEGVVNHDAGRNWTIEANTVTNNDGAGVFVGSGNVLRGNCLKDNGQYGFSVYDVDGVSDVIIDRNEIVGNNRDDWERRIDGCGCTGGAKFWDTDGALIRNNWVHDNLSVGLWADTNNTNFVIDGNLIENNTDEGFWYEISYNAVIVNNTFRRNALVKGREFASRQDPFPVPAVYISEAGGDARVAGPSTLEIAFNVFEDNWGGVTLWENADRFCSSSANTSTGECTLVGAASLNACRNANLIRQQPYFSDCRWKTQNVSVHHNVFRLNPSAIGCTNWYCARQSVLANYGTYAPYTGPVVQNAITFNQNNRWYSNQYFGPWRFMPFGTERNLSFNEWRAGPYNQDAGSTIA